MDADELQGRAKQLGMRGIRLVDALPRTTSGYAVGKQLVRCGTSVGANYRAARRARSRREFLAKLCIVVEEADETVYWLEIVGDSGLMEPRLVQPLLTEAQELMMIFARSRKSASSATTSDAPPASDPPPAS